MSLLEPSDVDNVRELIKTESTARIGEIYECSHAQVQRYMKLHGIENPRSHAGYNRDAYLVTLKRLKDAQILRYARHLLPLKVIAIKCKCSHVKVWNVIADKIPDYHERLKGAVTVQHAPIVHKITVHRKLTGDTAARSAAMYGWTVNQYHYWRRQINNLK